MVPKYYMYKRIVESKLYIDEHYTEAISIEELASISCFSPYHYISLFKKAYHITPRQYIRRKRFEKAKMLLLSGKPLREVCLAVGYSSPNTFALEFKKKNGVSPTAFVKKMQSTGSDCLNKDRPPIPQCFMMSPHYRNFR